MGENELFFMNLISIAILDQTPIQNSVDIDWNEIYILAVRHQLVSLIYSAIVKLNKLGIGPKKEIMTKWKNAAAKSLIDEELSIKKLEKVLEDLATTKTPIVLLKGLIIRNYYPMPQMRTMGDADIFIDNKHMETVRNLLLKFGYKNVASDFKHSMFTSEGLLDIEVHTSLVKQQYKHKTLKWEDTIWNGICPIKKYNSQLYCLSLEDHLIYLCLHMANHLMSAGFGLRQLCDLVLYVKANDASINWVSFNKKIDMIGIVKFVNVLFTICNKLFNADMKVLCNGINSEKQVRYMIDNIIKGGIFGKEIVRNVSNAHYLDTLSEKPEASMPNKFVRSMHLLFPPFRVMKYKYKYVRRVPLLLPISWVHRVINYMFRKDKVVSVGNDVKSLFSFHDQLEERYKLLKWLELI